MTVYIRKEGNLLQVVSPYNKFFISKMRNMHGKWNPILRVWEINEKYQSELEKIILKIYRIDLSENEESYVVEYNAKDFEKDDVIKINDIIMVYRSSRDSRVTLNNTEIVQGEFDKTGGSAKYPAVFERWDESDVILQSIIYKKEYEELSNEIKSKLLIIKENPPIKIDKEKMKGIDEKIKKQLKELFESDFRDIIEKINIYIFEVSKKENTTSEKKKKSTELCTEIKRKMNNYLAEVLDLKIKKADENNKERYEDIKIKSTLGENKYYLYVSEILEEEFERKKFLEFMNTLV